MNEECDDSGEKNYVESFVEPTCTEETPISAGTECKACEGHLHVWCGKFDPESQTSVCTPCSGKEITIKPSIIVDSEATTPCSSVRSESIEKSEEEWKEICAVRKENALNIDTLERR